MEENNAVKVLDNGTLMRKTKAQLVEIILRKDILEKEFRNNIKGLNKSVEEKINNIEILKDTIEDLKEDINIFKNQLIQERSNYVKEIQRTKKKTFLNKIFMSINIALFLIVLVMLFI